MLAGCRLHTWRMVMELRLRCPAILGRPLPAVHVATTHAALGDLMGFFPLRLNRVRATQTRFTLAMVFSGPGGGAWTVRVADGACAVSEEQDRQADLLLRQSPESFMKTCLGLRDLTAAIQIGEIVVQGSEHLGAFAALFGHQC